MRGWIHWEDTGVHARSWPTMAKPTLASVSVLVVWSTLAKTDFGQNRLCVFCVVCLCVACVLVSRFHGVGFHVWVLVWSCSGVNLSSPLCAYTCVNVWRSS